MVKTEVPVCLDFEALVAVGYLAQVYHSSRSGVLRMLVMEALQARGLISDS